MGDWAPSNPLPIQPYPPAPLWGWRYPIGGCGICVLYVLLYVVDLSPITRIKGTNHLLVLVLVLSVLAYLLSLMSSLM
ncbi:hypothetical protein [Caudoviricetes sp.]|nr:hypothetical protein [Caudoviricetes sp.]